MRIALLLVPFLVAGSSPSPRQHFDALVSEIGTLQQELNRLERQERSLLGEVERLDVEASLHAREMDRLVLLREQADREHAEITKNLGLTRDEVASGEALLTRHLREVYTAGRGRDLRVLLAIEEPADLLRRLAYLDAMAQRQAESLDHLNRDRASMRRLEDAVREQAATIEELARRERTRAIAREKARHEAAALLRAAQQDRQSHKNAISELTRAAENLEHAIVSGLAATEQTQGPLVDLDFGALKGVLEWPVEGRVSVPYGDVRHLRFGTMTPHPGLDIETSPRAPVMAVVGGRVVFSRRFSGYGNTVLIDHGKGYLSIYARLGTLWVTEGEQVLSRQTIGLTGDEGVEGGPPLVYFELRTDGSTVDPAGWLKRKPA